MDDSHRVDPVAVPSLRSGVIQYCGIRIANLGERWSSSALISDGHVEVLMTTN
jgi:hypothetical protein